MEKEYKVKLEVFEGPLDLLLYLIKRDEVDIYDIPIEHITTQYLEYIEAYRELDLDIAGEFVVMAATLIYIKSRSLLPVDQRPVEDVEEEDPRFELVRQLLEYKKFKDVAVHLSEREALQSTIFGRIPETPDLSGERPMAEVSIFDLINAFQKVLKKNASRRSGPREIYEESFTVSDKIEFVLRLTSERRGMRFTDLFTEATSRTEIVVTFLALLELVRLKHIRVAQPEPFAEIELERVG